MVRFKKTAFFILKAIFSISFLAWPITAHAQNTDQKTPSAKIASDGTFRFISGNGIPAHGTNYFPNAYARAAVTPQSYAFRVPLRPEKQTRTTPVPPNMFFGIALNGVPYDVSAEEFWQNRAQWPYEPLHPSVQSGTDANNGDTLENGAYVYRGIPLALITQPLTHVGYAADGFPIFVSRDQKYKSGYRLKAGKRESGPFTPPGQYTGQFSTDYEFVETHGNLDACNGVTVNNKYYIYILTEEFPYTPRCWSGTPDASFQKILRPAPSAQKQLQASPARSSKSGPAKRRTVDN